MEYSLEDLPIHFEGDTEPSTSGVKPKSLSDSESDFSYSDEDTDPGGENVKENQKKKRRTVTTKLSPHLKGLMGEANLRYARGDIDIAKSMCYEVIRQCPDAYEPYLTLSQMYENRNNKKYRGYLLLASHMFPQGVDIWCRLADLYLQENLIPEAISCYTKAIKYEPKNIELHKKRLFLLEGRKAEKPILKCKVYMAKFLPKKQHTKIIDTCMTVAKEYFSQKNYVKAIDTLDIPFKRVPDKVTQDLLNMMLELLLVSERYTECLDIFITYCGFSFDVSISEDQRLIINSYTLPPNLQIDLEIKFIICVIKLRSVDLIPTLINARVVKEDVEVNGDLYVDIVEALTAENMHVEALKLLVPLVKSKNFSLAAIWLKYAESLSACDMLDPAVEAYFTVMHLAPQHVEVLYPLAMLLLKQNKMQEALDVLSQDLTTNKIDVAVLIERMRLLKAINHLEDYWKCAELLLSRHCVILKNPEELKVVTIGGFTWREKMTKIKRMRSFRGEDDDIETNYISIREPSVEDEYKFLMEILLVAKETKNYGQFQRFSFMALCSKRFHKYYDEILICAYFSCLYNRDNFHGYTIIRDILLKHNSNNYKNGLAWNLFNIILQNPEDIRHNRFLERQQDKCIKSLKIIEANYDVSVGNYMIGLTFFMKEYKRTGSPYCLLMLGVSLTQMYCQRTIDKSKKKLLAETATYIMLQYAKTRSNLAKQEVYYNLGRVYQQMGVIYLAEFYYNKVLKHTNDLLEQHPDILCLKREAAYNMFIIYKNNGNYNAARRIISEHIVI